TLVLVLPVTRARSVYMGKSCQKCQTVTGSAFFVASSIGRRRSCVGRETGHTRTQGRETGHCATQADTRFGNQRNAGLMSGGRLPTLILKKHHREINNALGSQ